MVVQQPQLVAKPARVTKPMSEARRIRKPLMERKRRERINTSLNDLARLLTEAKMVKAEAGKATKLEKADILELTVKHIKALKTHDDAEGGAQAKEGSTKSQEEEKEEDKEQMKPPTTTTTSSYQEGFTRCMSVVEESLKRVGKESLRERLLTHLNACLKTLQPPTKSSLADTSKDTDQPLPPSSSSSVEEPDTADRLTETPNSQSAAVKCETAQNSRKGTASTIVSVSKDDGASQQHRLTLVPTRLATGGVAFVVQGGIDPSLLLPPQDCGAVGHLSTTTDEATESSCSTTSTKNTKAGVKTTIGVESKASSTTVSKSDEESDCTMSSCLSTPCTSPMPSVSTMSPGTLQYSTPMSSKEEVDAEESASSSSPMSSTPVNVSPVSRCPDTVSNSWEQSTSTQSTTQYLPSCSSISSSSTQTQFLSTTSSSTHTSTTHQSPLSISTTTAIATQCSPSSLFESTHHHHQYPPSTSTPMPIQYSAPPVPPIHTTPASPIPAHYLLPLEPASFTPTPIPYYTPTPTTSHTHTPPTPPPSVSPQQTFYHYPYQLHVTTSSEEDMYIGGEVVEREFEEDVDMEMNVEGEEGPYDLSMRRMWRPW